jgi:HAD superfamily hydrolase (TIGR01484 family)
MPTPLKDIRVLAVDLDETALGSSGRMDEVTVATLSDATQRGLHVVFVSARPLWSIRRLTAELPAASCAVAAGGAVVADEENRLLRRAAIPDETVALLVRLFAENRLSALLYRGDETYASGDSGAQRAEALVTSRTQPPPSWRGGDADKVLMFRPGGGAAPAGLDRIEGLHVTSSHGPFVEVNARDADKGTALRHLLDTRGWSAAAAIGDGDSDIPMLRLVGHAFCVANGSRRAREAADTVVAGNDDHGVASVARAWVAACGAARA